ncbi:hypothetical protein QBC46DRAFT_272112, partial [Diplogelasinospora grovesii]
VTFRSAIACAGLCLIHLGREDLPPEQRMQQFPNQDSWKRYISTCILKYIETYDPTSLQCPYPRCPVTCHLETDL